MSEQKQGLFSWLPKVNLNKEMMGQLGKPWAEATSMTLRQVHKLQQSMFERTQEALHETHAFISGGVKMCHNMTNRTHEIVQDQLKRFSA